MSTIAIVGAGNGVGAAVARRFGREGFRVALFSRNQSKLDGLAAELGEQNVTARGFAADVRDPAALSVALQAASHELGPIEVLQYSPIPHRDFLKPVLETTMADLAGAVEFSIYGPFTAVRQVLADMRGLRRGTIVFVNGGTSVRPRAQYAGTSIAFAGESAYAQILHEALEPEDVYVAQLVIPGAIRDDDPASNPGAIAQRIWALHVDRAGFRHFLTPMDAPR
jgi:NADP-dependent 3-hydroxy acid dehydrogenase YdfG